MEKGCECEMMLSKSTLNRHWRPRLLPTTCVVHMVLGEKTLQNTTAIPNMRCAILCICRHTLRNPTELMASVNLYVLPGSSKAQFFLP